MRMSGKKDFVILETKSFSDLRKILDDISVKLKCGTCGARIRGEVSYRNSQPVCERCK